MSTARCGGERTRNAHSLPDAAFEEGHHVTDNLKARIARRELTIGSWLNLGNPAVAEIMADAGFDWLVVDLEHTTTSLREAESLIRVVDLKGVTPLVRVSANDPVQIKRVLDAGAQGVIVPMVNSKADAEAAVTAVKYPPMGERGVGIGRAHGYGPGFDRYASTANDTTIIVAQIEHHRAIEQLEEIQSVPGIDATIIGPYDLSGSVGKLGQLDDPDVAALLERYETRSTACSRVMGVHVVPPDAALVRSKVRLGYTFVAFSVDFLFLGEACRRELRAILQDVEPPLMRRP
jgi:2-dehydro-3-deoxyglucarate aldolase